MDLGFRGSGKVFRIRARVVGTKVLSWPAIDGFRFRFNGVGFLVVGATEILHDRGTSLKP